MSNPVLAGFVCALALILAAALFVTGYNAGVGQCEATTFQRAIST